MQRDVFIKGRGLGGSSDLTLLAPIRPGFADSLESVTYRTRARRTIDALHTARKASHEYSLHRLISDSIERVEVIHSVRVAVFEPEDKVLLSVTFDGPWESYIRVLWSRVGSLLDLIFCSTQDYVTAWDHPFEDWAAWARRVQVETGFFYGPPDFSARDLLYWRRIDRMQQRGALTEANVIGTVLPGAQEAVRLPWGVRPDDLPRPPWDEFTQVRSISELAKGGLLGLAGLYRLTDLYLPGTPDGETLRVASLNLLDEFVRLVDRTVGPADREEMRKRFARQLDWLFPGGDTRMQPQRQRPAVEALGPADAADIQGGILTGYEPVSHGLVLFVAFDGPAAAATFLERILPAVTRDDTSAGERDGTKPFTNIAFTPAGLRACGLVDADIELFPEDFLQGMAARAGALGDVRTNHPRRWRMPGAFTGSGAKPDAANPVELGAVHALVQLRCNAPGSAAIEYHDANHPLRGRLDEIAGWQKQVPGFRLLAVQAMKRQYNAAKQVIEHFGFADGAGQPGVGPQAMPPTNRTHLGEYVHGHANAADEAPRADDPSMPPAAAARLRWLRNGSFLVVRRYRQNVQQLHDAVDHAARDLAAKTQLPLPQARDEVYGKLVGRRLDGTPVVPGAKLPNDFDYAGDPQGLACPLHAHIRRAHPRGEAAAGERPARIMRRGMSWGPPAAQPGERGLMFMAYNASLSEQFEVVQRWLVGGNSTGSSSGEGCPLLGVPEGGQPRTFRFVHEDHGQKLVIGVPLEAVPEAYDEPETVTRLEWGLYLFAPSLSVLRRLHHTAVGAVARLPSPGPAPWRSKDGRATIAALRQLEASEGTAAAIAAWKAAIEDPDAVDRMQAAGLWAAIREDHGGVLRTPYGVLVASRELALQVLHDRDRYSVRGQAGRMHEIGMGGIFLGVDGGRQDGTQYAQLAASVNDVIGRLDVNYVFEDARAAADRKLAAIAQDAMRTAMFSGAGSWQVTFDLREVLDEVVGDLTDEWFGIQSHFARGGTDWGWKEGDLPIYPGQFTALSRYLFQPRPGPVPAELARRYGLALTARMREFVQAHRAPAGQPRDSKLPRNRRKQVVPLAAATFLNPLHGLDDDYAARTMVGVIMGYTPTIIGAVLNVVKEWSREGTFATLRAASLANPAKTHAAAQAQIGKALKLAAQMRPMPPLIWRTVRMPHAIGSGTHAIELHPDDLVVVASVAGTQQSLQEGRLDDGQLMFGGERKGSGAPTHACPGYDAAMSAMLGTLAALLQRTEDLRETGTPGIYEFRGPVARPLPSTPRLAGDGKPVHAPTSACPQPVPPSSGGLVIACGDSWVGYMGLGVRDLRDWLAEWGYQAPDDWTGFGRIATLAAHSRELARQVRDRYEPRGLRALVLSGGGNDSVGGQLHRYVREKAHGIVGAIDPAALRVHLRWRIARSYLRVIRRVRAAGSDVPIFLHGYDHPIPEPVGFPGWMRGPFVEKKWVDPQLPQDATVRVDMPAVTQAMRDLIDGLNDTLQAVAARCQGVHYVDLRGSVASLWSTASQGWIDNLHPEEDGFRCMTAKLAASIEKNAPRTAAVPVPATAHAATPDPAPSPAASPRHARE